jgi:transcriptional regulator with GAF, ATPase, and Fis domain
MLQFLVESSWEKKLYRVSGDEIVIGRSRAVDIPLLDEGAKKRHARVLRDAAGYRFESLVPGGVKLNGKAADSGPLRVGDRLEIAVTQVTLQSVLADRAPDPAGRESGSHPTPSRPLAPLEAERSVRLDPGSDSAFLAGGLRAILDINKRLGRERDEERLLALIMDSAIDLTGADRGFLLTLEDGKIRARAAYNLEGVKVEDPELKISRTIARRAMQTRRAVLSSDAGSDERWTGMESIAALNLRSVLSVPLVSDDGVLGALYVDHRFEPGTFTDAHVRLLEAFADQAALAIHSSRLSREMERRGKELERKNREVENLNARLAVDLDKARSDLKRRQTELEFRFDYAQIVGRSQAIKKVLSTLDKVTDLNVPVFIEGESGTGKELVARALHFNGPRKEAPFVTENCSAIPETLIEKVLFGHVKGAFTGADRDAPGLFEQAHGGTLFLDEVGDMGEEMQKKILRVLQEGEVRRVGDKAMRKVDVRIVAATNRDVDELKADGRFREDLYWRLVVVKIVIPPLRQRPEDIPLLVDHFLDLSCEEMGTPRKTVEGGALDLLVRYSWPGNVRELMNEVRRAVALAGDRISAETLSERIRTAPPSPVVDWTRERTLKEVVEEVEKTMIARELERFDGNKTRVAKALGLSRLGLRNKIERYGLGS